MHLLHVLPPLLIVLLHTHPVHHIGLEPEAERIERIVGGFSEEFRECEANEECERNWRGVSEVLRGVYEVKILSLPETM